MKRFLSLVIAIAITLTSAPVSAGAATKIVKALQYGGYFMENPTKDSVKKPSAIPSIKNGSIVSVTDEEFGYIRYKAPKDGKYKITCGDFDASLDSNLQFIFLTDGFDNLKTSQSSESGFSTMTLMSKQTYAKLKEENDSEAVKKAVTRHSKNREYFVKRSLTTNLKKGQTLYIKLWLHDDKSTKTAKFKFNVKRVS